MSPRELVDLSLFKGTFKALDEKHGEHLNSDIPIGLFDGWKLARSLQAVADDQRKVGGK